MHFLVRYMDFLRVQLCSAAKLLEAGLRSPNHNHINNSGLLALMLEIGALSREVQLSEFAFYETSETACSPPFF